MDSVTATVQHPAWRGSRSQDRWSSPRLGHPNLGAEDPEQFFMKRDCSTLGQEGEYNYWVNHQAALDSATNIRFLSGEMGYLMLSKFINQGNLPDKTIAIFVKLLAREEIRTSLLRQNTNKIYGVLTGSPFLFQLKDHVTSHLGMLSTPKPQDVRPYLALTEELQSRSMEGWKEVPLNALKVVVSKLEENAAKDDLVAIVSRITDHCKRLPRSVAAAQTEQQYSKEEEFWEMSIVPTEEDLVGLQADQKLPVNAIGIQYSRVTDYLETHFRLLREMCIDPLRQGIKSYRCTHDYTNSKAKLDLMIYLGVQIVGIRCGHDGLEFVVSFHLPGRENLAAEDWESSSMLVHGSLLCISSDQFETFFLGVVGRRDVKELAKGLISIRLMGEVDANFRGKCQKGRASTESYVMVESTTYFGAHSHALEALQSQAMEKIPFTPHLLHLEPRVSPPSYLQERKTGDEYDFSCAFPDILEKLGTSCIRIMQSEWPSGWADSLDRTQQEALKHGLKKELAIIEGPPGTGKTFLGLILIRILLANLDKSRWAKLDEEACDLIGPILIICSNNHALDHFLEGIYRNGERNLIRLGRQSKSEMLKDRTLESLLRKQRLYRVVDRNHQRLIDTAKCATDLLESKILRCTDSMGVEIITDTMLNGIATQEQRQSLFCIDQTLKMLTEQYEEACKGVKEAETEMKLSMLRSAKVVGMTQVAGAKYYDVLKSLKPAVVIVKKAEEVFEGDLLACISPSVKHLILFGDLLQVRPAMSGDKRVLKHGSYMSMFERLIRSGVEYVTLQEQRRMRPNISKLVRSVYPGSRDHESVAPYEDVVGMKSNLFFFDHEASQEDEKVNNTEAKLVVELCLYLLKQGCYKLENIAILSMSASEISEIKRLLQPKIHSSFSVKAIGGLEPYQDPGAEQITLLPRLSTVYDYQAGESDIIIFSLGKKIYSDSKEDVGNSESHKARRRTCMALTRARKGLYIFGNADLLAKNSALWNDVTTSMRNSGELGSQLDLICQKHPHIITRISSVEDFKQVVDGGCDLPCDFQFACGHSCPKRCHPGSHDLISCAKPCLRQHDDCGHSCNLACHGSANCPPCKVIVTKNLPHCADASGESGWIRKRQRRRYRR